MLLRKLCLSFSVFVFVFLVIVAYIMMSYVTYSNLPFLNSDTFNASYCRPQKYIVFIKVHKTGSTSVMNILQRYGMSKNLTFILPSKDNYLGKQTTIHLSSRILVPSNNRAINILCNHVVYNRAAFRKALNGRRMDHKKQLDGPGKFCNRNLVANGGRCGSQMGRNRTAIDISDYTLFTMIRRPLAQVLSASYYYNLFPGVAADNLMGAILLNSTVFTNNRMSFDLGLPFLHAHNSTKVQEFINGIDADFDIVLLMEYFDESMVLLRRYLCLQTANIIYIKRNSGGSRPRIRVSSEQRERFRKLRAPADCALYDYFRPRFWSAVHAEGPDFFNEVHHYRSLLSLVKDYCSFIQDKHVHPKRRNSSDSKNSDNRLRIAASQWHSEFFIGTEQCDIMTMHEVALVARIRKLQYGK